MVDKMATVPWEVDQRSRSSTWPVPDPEQVMDPRVYYQGDCQRQPMPGEYMELPPEYDATIQPEEKPHLNTSPEISGMVRPSPTSGTPEPKKPRNPWGEMSYADLITKAILSAPEKRLTLSEIYTWMIENVPYFREKANETSTSGWKVCVCVFMHVCECVYVSRASIVEPALPPPPSTPVKMQSHKCNGNTAFVV